MHALTSSAMPSAAFVVLTAVLTTSGFVCHASARSSTRVPAVGRGEEIVEAQKGQHDPARTKTPPHIVLMIVDEMGTGDVPWADTTIHAPTIARLGQDGVRLGTMCVYGL